MIKAILFDMDGVLIDAREWHYNALNKALSLFGYAISRESHLSTFDGLPTRQKLKLLVKAKIIPEGLSEFINTLKQRYTLEISAQLCKPVFNQRNTLANLKRKNYKIAVCSNSVRQTVETMMELSSLESYIDFMISNEDVKNGKPDPEMYIHAMDFLKLSPEECLIIEDNEHGVKSAIASGAYLLRVSSPDQVTFENIINRIREIDNLSLKADDNANYVTNQQ